jgi:hypothetical protein
MKKIALVALLTAGVAGPAFAGEGGPKPGQRCNVRHLAGEWLTAFEYGDTGAGAVACRIAVNREGAMVRAFCLQDDITTRLPATGSFAVDNLCQVTGDLTVGLNTYEISGELSDRRDLVVGLVKYGTSFDPFTAVRTGNPSKGKVKNPFDDDDETEVHLSCKAGDDAASLEVKYEESTKSKKGKKASHHQFRAEFEAAGGGDLEAGTEVSLVIGDTVVDTRVLVLEDDELEADFAFNSHRKPLPDTVDVVEGAEVAVAVDGTTVLACTLAVED